MAEEAGRSSIRLQFCSELLGLYRKGWPCRVQTLEIGKYVSCTGLKPIIFEG